ncbi:hypothetical protein [Halorhabdus sp. CUG00001]|uniref:hypothetical protein n=1 Tax=Halorhabdus sp. CUG00001 TaxID=2600297 RepID=UPI00131CC8AC|nr:hypothetical protein [Halorhabdus sp. CUG00001]
MTDSPVPLSGTTLLAGPSQVGKTRTTARAFEAWLDRHGTDGVVVLEFAPEVERDGELLGGRLDRFTSVPDDVWHGVLDAHAPRADATSDDEALALARENAEHARTVLEAAPKPTAVFVNDATIPFQADHGNVSLLVDHLADAECAVLNAFESDELGAENPVSRRERDVVGTLRERVDWTINLE